MNFKYTLNVLAAAHASIALESKKTSSKEQRFTPLSFIAKSLSSFLGLSH